MKSIDIPIQKYIGIVEYYEANHKDIDKTDKKQVDFFKNSYDALKKFIVNSKELHVTYNHRDVLNDLEKRLSNLFNDLN